MAYGWSRHRWNRAERSEFGLTGLFVQLQHVGKPNTSVATGTPSLPSLEERYLRFLSMVIRYVSCGNWAGSLDNSDAVHSLQSAVLERCEPGVWGSNVFEEVDEGDWSHCLETIQTDYDGGERARWPMQESACLCTNFYKMGRRWAGMFQSLFLAGAGGRGPGMTTQLVFIASPNLSPRKPLSSTAKQQQGDYEVTVVVCAKCTNHHQSSRFGSSIEPWWSFCKRPSSGKI